MSPNSLSLYPMEGIQEYPAMLAGSLEWIIT